jgi:hypothetical protein
VADAKIGLDRRDLGLTNDQAAEKYVIHDAPQNNPLTVDESALFMMKGEDSVSWNSIRWWKWDLDGDGVFEAMIPGAARSYFWSTGKYSDWEGRSNCERTSTPAAITCKIVFEIENSSNDPDNNTKQDFLYIRILKPCKEYGDSCNNDEDCCSGFCTTICI